MAGAAGATASNLYDGTFHYYWKQPHINPEKISGINKMDKDGYSPSGTKTKFCLEANKDIMKTDVAKKANEDIEQAKLQFQEISTKGIIKVAQEELKEIKLKFHQENRKKSLK